MSNPLLVKGAHVIIIANSSVISRNAELVGQRGVVKEAPGNAFLSRNCC